MNIYDCRFVDENDVVRHVKQYGNSEEEIETFWNKWWFEHYDCCPSVGRFIDCELYAEDVKEWNFGRNCKEIAKIEKMMFLKEE